MKQRLEEGHRRVPLQDRSRLRVERILDAAAGVFAEKGYEAASTEAIAQAAETSVGSIYQFYPNKRALFAAISVQYLERCREIFDTLIAEASPEASWEDLLGRSIDAFVTLHTEPGFRAVWKNWQVSADVLEAGEALNREFAERIGATLGLYAPRLPAPKRGLVATVVVEVISALILAGARNHKKFADDIAQETKTLLVRYLAPIMQGRRRARRSK